MESCRALFAFQKMPAGFDVYPAKFLPSAALQYLMILNL